MHWITSCLTTRKTFLRRRAPRRLAKRFLVITRSPWWYAVQARPAEGPCITSRVLTLDLYDQDPTKKHSDDKGTDCACKTSSKGEECKAATPASTKLPGKVLYGSQKGTTVAYANQLVRQAATFGVELQAVDLSIYEVEQLWKEHLVFVVLSTYEGGSPPDAAK